MNPSNLEECREIIKDIDSHFIDLLSNNQNYFNNYENNYENDIDKIINNNIILNIFNNLNISFKVNFNNEIRNIIISLLNFFNINDIKNLNDIIECITKRVYIAHFVADFKLNINLKKFTGLSKENIMKSITYEDVEKRVLNRILQKCNNINLNEQFTNFIVNFYNDYLILNNKRLQVDYIYLTN